MELSWSFLLNSWNDWIQWRKHSKSLLLSGELDVLGFQRLLVGTFTAEVSWPSRVNWATFFICNKRSLKELLRSTCERTINHLLFDDNVTELSPICEDSFLFDQKKTRTKKCSVLQQIIQILIRNSNYPLNIIATRVPWELPKIFTGKNNRRP